MLLTAYRGDWLPVKLLRARLSCLTLSCLLLILLLHARTWHGAATFLGALNSIACLRLAFCQQHGACHACVNVSLWGGGVVGRQCVLIKGATLLHVGAASGGWYHKPRSCMSLISGSLALNPDVHVLSFASCVKLPGGASERQYILLLPLVVPSCTPDGKYAADAKG